MRRPAADERELWRRAVRDVAALSRRPKPPDPEYAPATRNGVEAQATRPPSARSPLSAPPLPPLDRFAGLDRASAERLKRGRYPVEARLDLHGMTQAEAYRALARFVAGSRAAGRRCVLVITGHGRMSGGVLKAAVPRWLDEPELRPHLLAIMPARQRDGGAGALYLLLRRLPS
jgi:DNA-nicking Smr family endonuclease